MPTLMQIQDALASLSISVTDGTDTYDVKSIAPSDEQEHVNSFPIRVITPLAGDQGHNLSFQTRTKLKRDHTITDLMLWAHTADGSLGHHVAWLTRYFDVYTEAIQQNRDLGLDETSIVNVRLDVGIFQYPLGSTNEYAGVEAIVTLISHS